MVERRNILKTAWKVGVGVLLVEAAWTTWEALKPLAKGRAGGKLALASPDSYAERSVTYIPEAQLYVSRVKGEFFAISQSCPHLGCKVPFCEASGRFECPCHGSKYDLAGEWLEGPSPHGMNRYQLAIEDGRLTVDTRVLKDGPPLGTREYFTPHRGGRCGPEEA